MSRNELNEFLKILNAKHLELSQSGGRRDEIAIERTADTLDEIWSAAERELTTRSLARKAELLHNVRAALDRIADGSYGACFECEEEISHKRLRAIPWATFCIDCQEQNDQGLRKAA